MKPQERWGMMGILVILLGIQLFCQNRIQDKFMKVFLPGGQAITAELAVTDEEHAQGLMFREKILPDQGMLFVFSEESPHTFWMKNTLIPLDMIWLGRDRRIIHIVRNAPPCPEEPCPTYGPDVPILFVLELKGGQADAFGLKIGDRLEFILPSWLDGSSR